MKVLKVVYTSLNVCALCNVHISNQAIFIHICMYNFVLYINKIIVLYILKLI